MPLQIDTKNMSRTFSNKLNLVEVFAGVSYIAIMRMSPDFPNYYAGSDIDILHFSGIHIIDDFTRMFPLNHIHLDKHHQQLDYYHNGKLDLKFDLYSRVISKKFTRRLIITSKTIVIDGEIYYVPSDDFDGMLKCYEYLKFPKKKKRYQEFLKYKDQLDEYTN